MDTVVAVGRPPFRAVVGTDVVHVDTLSPAGFDLVGEDPVDILGSVEIVAHRQWLGVVEQIPIGRRPVVAGF